MRFFVTVSFILLLSACANPNKFSMLEPEELLKDFSCENIARPNHSLKDNHLVRSNRDGLFIAPRSKNEKVPPESPRKALASMRGILCNAEEEAMQRGWEGVNIFVHVHGGLNGFHSSNARLRIAEHILNEGHYPVYLAWPSGAFTTWTEHTFRIREGKKANPFVGAVTSPFILTADIFRSVGNFPSTVSYQATNEKDRIASKHLSSWLQNSWRDGASLFCPSNITNPKHCHQRIKNAPELSVTANYSSFYSGGFSKQATRGAFQVLTLPVRYTIGSLWHSGISSAAWGNMKRRAKNITYPTHELDSRYANGLKTGAFFRLLAERAYNHPEKNYKITLIGHSMGAIVINNILSRYSYSWAKSPSLKNIIYMAGAATISDSLAALAPVLVPREGIDGNLYSPDFFNLTLNRVAEISETHFNAILPTGSLLISIDQHHDKPEHPLNRTIGSEVNVLSSLHIIDEALQNSTGAKVFKSFDRKEGHFPSLHGDFGKIPFWRRSTWELKNDKSNAGEPYPIHIFDKNFKWVK